MKREEDKERRQKGGTVDFFFDVSTCMFRVLYGSVFFSKKKIDIFLEKREREDFKIRDTKRTHTLTYQKTIILSRYQHHQRKL